MSKEDEEKLQTEGVELASKLDSALRDICPPFHEALALFGSDRALWAGIIVMLHFAYFMLAPRCLMWIISSPTWYLLPSYSTMVAANKPGEPRMRALWISYWIIVMILRLLERILLGWVAQSLKWLPLVKIVFAVWLMCETTDSEAPAVVDAAQQRRDREAYRALDQTYRQHFKEDLENAMNDSKGTTMEDERRKRARDELRSKLKKELERTVAKPRRFHASMLIEPFIPNAAHSSGDTFTDDRTTLRDRSKKHKEDKWFTHMKALEAETAGKAANRETDRVAGNPIVNRDGSFIRYRKGETEARQQEPDEKYQRFLDLLGVREYNPAPGQRVDFPYGQYVKNELGQLERGAGTYQAGYTPDDGPAMQEEMERLYQDVDEDEEAEYRTGTYIHQPYSRQQVAEYNYSRDAHFD